MLNLFKIIIANRPILFSRIHIILGYSLVNLLCMPWKLIDFIFFKKKINNHIIKNDPIFIIGHWRSGTTLLQNILTKDKGKAYINFYQSFFPSFFLSTEWLFKPFLQFIVKLLKSKIPFFNIPFSWDFPAEDDTTLLIMNSPASAYWAYAFPIHALNWIEKTMFYTGADDKHALLWEKHFLFLIKKISFKNKGKQLILKSPPNTARIEQILKLFPDAKFVYISRNPVEIYYSYFALWKKTSKSFAVQKTSDELNDRIILDTLKKMISSYHKNKHLIPVENLYEVSYTDFLTDPMTHLEKIYDKLELDNYEHSIEDFTKYLEENKSYRTSNYNFEPEKCKEIEELMNTD